MKVTVTKTGSWKIARKLARITVNREDIDKPVSDLFKKRSIVSEHSHIRAVWFLVEIEGLPTWMAQQMSRHRIATISGDFMHEGVKSTDVEHFVQTQRPDRANKERGGQNELINYSFLANIQGLIDMTKKRSCMMASKEHREVWHIVLERIMDIEPILPDYLVKSCIYRGFCPEKTCGFDSTEKFKSDLNIYRSKCKL